MYLIIFRSVLSTSRGATLEIPSKTKRRSRGGGGETEKKIYRRRRRRGLRLSSERASQRASVGVVVREEDRSNKQRDVDVDEEDALKEKLQVLKKNVKDEHMFEEAVSSIKSLLTETYPSSSPSLQKYIYCAVCWVATILHKKKYTSPARFWIAGKDLFKEAERLITNSSQRQHLKTCIATARNHLHQIHHPPDPDPAHTPTGHNNNMVVEDLEPSRPTLVVAQDLLATLGATPESSCGQREENNNPSGRASALMEELVHSMEEISGLQALEDAIEATWRSLGSRPLRAPPASKEVVAKLPIITITEEILARLGRETECAVCKENLVATDRMQELPCKHLLHLLCLEPWLDKHNSCPVCRHELPTDNQPYESWKKQEEAILKKNETGDSCMFS